MLPYATIKRKISEKEWQRNVVSASATTDIHNYFLCSFAIKFTFLLKGINEHKQHNTITMHQGTQTTKDVDNIFSQYRYPVGQSKLPT